MIRSGFYKRAQSTMVNSMDVMPSLVKGNHKLQKVVNRILNSRLGTKKYSATLTGIKGLLEKVKKYGKNSQETQNFAKSLSGQETSRKGVKLVDALSNPQYSGIFSKFRHLK